MTKEQALQLMERLADKKKYDNHQTTHGYSRTKVYAKWAAMKSRCQNPKATLYPKYGGKGITVCDRWNTFENFLEDMGVPPDGKTSIDRIDPLKGYYKENCRWASLFEQGSEHKTNLRLYTMNGKTMNVRAWERYLGYNYQVLTMRMKRGLTFEEAVAVGLPS